VKKKTAAGLTPAQMEIMELVWQGGEIGVAEVWKALSQRRPIARNTVQTTLARLHERGWLRVREEGNAFVYAAARPRQSVVSRMVERLADTAFGGSLSGLVAAIVESPRLSAEEAKRIRAIIAAAGAAPAKGNTKDKNR
jgi:BlaI family transcriptional regulator, penicillinase repressor